MIKTGATVLWQRLPIHLVTTLPHVPYFSIYSDAPDRVAGIEVIDILANVSQRLKKSDDFSIYRKQQSLLEQNSNIEPWQKEAKIEGGWTLDKYKNLPMVAHAYRNNPNLDWYIFMDADSYILWPNMIRWLMTLNPEDKLYMGSVAYLNNEPFAHGGSGVVMSRGLLNATFGKEPDLEHKYDAYTQVHCCGDHVLAHAFMDHGEHVLSGNSYPYVHYRFQGEPPRFMRFFQDNWCAEVNTFHHLTAHDVTSLYQFEKQFDEEHAISHADVYRYFIEPYITSERKDNWDNVSDGEKFTKDSDNVPAEVYNTYDGCEKRCKEDSECYQFRFKEGECQLSRNIRLGCPDDNKKTAYSSGWNVDRINRMRKQAKCDPLK
ncbi:hypothetical protein V1511DRAFT_454942 [Dipodascopsis uninucleata]